MLKEFLSQEEIEEIKTIVIAVFQGAEYIASGESYGEYYLNEDENDLFYIEDFKNFLINNGIENVNVDFGLTKIVLIPNDKNYVIKIPITKIGYYDYVVKNGKYKRNKFVIGNNNLGDYCLIEEKLFNSFSDDLKKIFAETKFITKVNNLPIYIQEKVEMSYSQKLNMFNPKHYPSDRKNKKDICYNLNSINEYKEFVNYSELSENFCYDILINYGVNSLIELLQTINKIGITDLHTKNYGYNRKNKPMIFDYSGYGE